VTTLASRWDIIKNLPNAAVARRVYRLAKDGKREVPMGCAAGPAVLWLYCAHAVLWPFLFLITWHASTIDVCSENNLARYPFSLWGVFCHVALWYLYCEWQAMKYSTIPYVQAVGVYRHFALEMPWKVWFCTSMVLSLLNLADMYTDTLVIGSILATTQCDSMDKIDNIWGQVLDQSVLGKMGLFSRLPCLSILRRFAIVSLACYSLVVLQIIVALMYTVPIPDSQADNARWQPDFEVGMDDEDTPEEEKLKLKFKTLLNPHGNHGDSLYTLGEAGGMASIASQVILFTSSREEQVRAQKPSGWELRCVNHMISMLKQIGTIRILLHGVLESSLQLNVQVTLFTILRALREDDGDANSKLASASQLQFNLSITIGAGMCLLKIVELKEVIQKTWYARAALRDSIEQVKRDPGHPDHRAIDDAWSRLNWGMCRVWLYGLVLVLTVTYALVKLYMADRRDCLIWSVTGCADLVFPTTNSSGVGHRPVQTTPS